MRDALRALIDAQSDTDALSATGFEGSLYYRDPVQRTEWLSSQFSFDAMTVCVTERENLDALVNGFNARISGAYSP